MEVISKAARKSAKTPTAKAKNNNNFNIENQSPEDIKQEKQPNKAELLLELVNDEDFFHDEQKNPFVTFKSGEHFETWPLECKKFREWLFYKFWSTHGKAINAPALNDALAVLNGKAIYEGTCHKVFSRVGYYENKIYINLANTDWQVIEVSTDGWRILDSSPIKFTGLTNMRALPNPVNRQGNFDLLWKHINVSKDAELLITAWLLDAFMVNTPYPILLLTGLEGSGKSTTQERLRELIDPSTSNLRSPPKKSDDIYTAAQNNYLVSYNNVSSLTDDNQDDLCCLATGGGYATRGFYTDSTERVADVKRPIIMNGICDFITRQDLLDRTVSIRLPVITPKNRKSENILESGFNHDLPYIFTGLLNLLVSVLRAMPTIKLVEKPRMASFAIVGEALAKVLHLPDRSFENIYRNNYQRNMIDTLDNSTVAVAVMSLLKEEQQFEGTYLDLMDKLYWHRPNHIGWPRSPKSLSNALKRLVSAFKLAGVEFYFEDKSRNDGYHLKITKLEKEINN
ncbi:MAG: hypothetical protein HYX60_07560 [Legionella longbeachae]|nr:hypothetical protein [Legionella longbeachae]